MSLLPQIRAQFPALSGPDTFFDNAGGSQLPAQVIDAMTRFFRNSFVQLNGDYATSKSATETVRRAHEVVKIYLNAHNNTPGDEVVGRGLGEIIIASSTTTLCHMLANAYADARATGAIPASRDEVIVCTAGHEANVGAWLRLANRGFKVTPWQAEPVPSGPREMIWRPSLARLKSMLSSRTAVVTLPQVSNVLGETWDPRPFADACHEAGAKLVVDGVAYAPHHAPDVGRMGCDWYLYSTYKVFGPHAAAMFGHRDAFRDLTGPNHEFIPKDTLPAKWEIGGANPEAAAGIAALADYVHFLATASGGPSATPRQAFESAFHAIEAIEIALQKRFMGFLASRPGVRIIGPAASDASRVATIAFVSEKATPQEISAAMAAKRIGIRQGHSYSKRLLDAMGVPVVARVSFAHYNSPAEVDRLCEELAALI